ncbi:hypothetical protein BDV59DRAFT_185877 [Aspergillus ambiguus]|uniref:Zn(II)2Cys6 transcription factor n=1 Tax=Aspergillus ambiguus TaxID=176160 RepID=UPI003CCD2DE3
MPTRRSHQKSHTGCVTCKRRHVKCDEKGPPCGRCKTRGTDCEYAQDNVRSRVSPAIHNQGSSEEIPETAGNPIRVYPIYPADKRRLELQLMHQWSTRTYKSCCTPGSGDDELWQATVPVLALQHDFLLNGLLALSAFEIAYLLKHDKQQESDHSKYVKVATEYQVVALSGFRSRLSAPSHGTHTAMLCFSLMLMVLALASVQFSRDSSGDNQESVVHIAITHFELVRGCVQVAETEEGHISQNAYVQKLIPFEKLPCIPLDPLLADALAKLSTLNDGRIVSTVLDVHERRVQQVAYWEACKKALTALQECFQKCVGQVYRGYALGWLNMAGEGYIQAVKGDDHIALLILMFWGVLVERLGHDIWWANQFGTFLVDEVSSGALNSDRNAAKRDVILQAQQLMKRIADNGAKS